MNIHIARKILGYSVKGQPIEGVFFGGEQLNTPNGATPPVIDTLFFGAFHGDEGISTELLKATIAAWSEGRFHGHPIDFSAQPVLMIPALKPDGLDSNTRVKANGVDLNRNYPTPDWIEENLGTRYYSGSSPSSEPETQLVISLIELYQPKKIVTVHSPYKVINFDGPAQALAEAMAACSGYPVVDDIGYPTPGSFGHFAGLLRQIPVITLELPEDETLEQVWKDNAASLEAAVRFSIPAPSFPAWSSDRQSKDADEHSSVTGA